MYRKPEPLIPPDGYSGTALRASPPCEETEGGSRPLPPRGGQEEALLLVLLLLVAGERDEVDRTLVLVLGALLLLGRREDAPF